MRLPRKIGRGFFEDFPFPLGPLQQPLALLAQLLQRGVFVTRCRWWSELGMPVTQTLLADADHRRWEGVRLVSDEPKVTQRLAARTQFGVAGVREGAAMDADATGFVAGGRAVSRVCVIRACRRLASICCSTSCRFRSWPWPAGPTTGPTSKHSGTNGENGWPPSWSV